MKYISDKAISLFAAFSIFGCSIWWIVKFWHAPEPEPIITLIGSATTILFQLKGWQRKVRKVVLQSPPTGEPQTFPRLFDFSKDKCEVIIEPLPLREKYWRVGFKMSRDGSHHIFSPLEIGAVLFSVEQTQDQIHVVYHDENDHQVFRRVLITNYHNEKIRISFYTTPGQTAFTVQFQGHAQFNYSIIEQFRYGNFISWGDNRQYEINVTVKDN